MNANSFRALEFETVRGLLLTYGGSAAGRARLQALAPSTDKLRVRESLRTTTEAVAVLATAGRQPYHDLPVIDEALAGARVRGLHLEPAQLRDVASFAEGAVEIARQVAACESAPSLSRRAARVRDASDMAGAIRRAILPTGEVADSASPRLAEARRAIARMRSDLHSVMESFLRGKDADRVLQDKLITTRNDRYVLLLKAEHRGQLPGIIHGSSGSGASFFVEPLPAVELNNDIVAKVDEERREVVRVLQELTARVGERAQDLGAAVEILAELDAAQAMALLAKDMDARAPEIVEWQPMPEAAREGEFTSPQHAGGSGGARRSAPPLDPKDAREGEFTSPQHAGGSGGARRSAPPLDPKDAREGERASPQRTSLLNLKHARHPLLMSSLAERLGIARRSSRDAVPVTIRIDARAPVLVISGPNTGGKTVALKTVGLLAMMAQSGLLIPVAEGSTLPVFQRIYADIGDDQSIAENLSTFSAHLAAVAAMTRDLSLPALVLLDEVGAGTDPTEGGALGVAIVDGFRRRGAMVLATTHHGLMKAYAQSAEGVACASFGYDAETYAPTYRLELDAPGRSLAFEMAERLGLPADMVQDARSRRERKEEQAELLLKTLEEKEKGLAREEQRILELREDAEQASQRVREAERDLAERKRRELEGFARELRRRADEAARRAAEAIHEAVSRLETERKTQSAAARLRSEAIAEIREVHEEILRDPALALPAESEAPLLALLPGARVRVATLGVVGEVIELHGENEIEVAVAGKRLRVPRSALAGVLASPPQRAESNGSFLARAAGAASAARARASQAGGSSVVTKAVPAEINLVGLNVEEALARVDKLLDDATLSDRREIRVIHGFGQGKLRRAIAELLEGHPQVAAFRPGSPREGGGGATIVELKE